MSNQSLADFSSAHLPKVNQVMRDFLQKVTTEQSLWEAMDYSVSAGGKRIRPLLFLATLDFLGVELKKEHYEVAAALEMVHTYSLIHDDLPAMDNDDLRRGKPTNHKVFGEGMAILAGDGLLTEAFHLVASVDLTSDLRVMLLEKLASAAGTNGMIAGQTADIEGENRQLDLKQLQKTHQRKTGALILFAVQAACKLAQAEQEIEDLMTVYGENYGIAFQIKDDILDVVGDEQELGKKTGSDESLNKSTYTSLLGIEGAQKKLEHHIDQAVSSLHDVQDKISKKDVSLLEKLIWKLR
ncbi:polyprenyl synthetase family protein [Vagococcus elongatus]|uniref:Farnesyl diphosphate synthase n=1 Tax=Vagococcus elongatus TaxID=180344 RepID=A0A430AYB0_9ENTE|nr:farnesyl diphosphate synthase [Vagococcus elongatus]RSU13047.1 hypothetical protein CBF29_05090 [Vagococcus elongatus]